MKLKDERIKVTNEAFGAVRLVKMYAWEESFQRTIDLLINWSTSELNTLLDPTVYMHFKV